MEIIIKSRTLQLWQGDVVRSALTTARNDVSRKWCKDFTDDEFSHYLQELSAARSRIQARAGTMSLLFSGVASVVGGFTSLSAFANKPHVLTLAIGSALLVFCLIMAALFLVWTYLLADFDKASDELRAYWKKLREDEEAENRDKNDKAHAKTLAELNSEAEKTKLATARRLEETRRASEATAERIAAEAAADKRATADREHAEKLAKDAREHAEKLARDAIDANRPQKSFRISSNALVDMTRTGARPSQVYRNTDTMSPEDRAALERELKLVQSADDDSPAPTGVRAADETTRTHDDAEEKEAQTPDPPNREERKA